MRLLSAYPTLSHSCSPALIHLCVCLAYTHSSTLLSSPFHLVYQVHLSLSIILSFFLPLLLATVCSPALTSLPAAHFLNN